MRLVTPLRFVSGVIGLWVAGRMIVLMPDMPGETAAADASLPPAAGGTAMPARPVDRSASGSAMATMPAAPSPAPIMRSIAVRGMPVAAIGAARPAAGATQRPLLLLADGMAQARPPHAAPLSPAGLVAPAVAAGSPEPGGLAASPRGSRWSGNLYLFRRGDGEAALATGGQLGGSQAGARLAYRLNPAGPTRLAAAARLATPLDDAKGAEAALGLDLRPLPGRPLRVSVERRVDLGGRGRNAWSAYTAGGFYRETARGLVLDGYAQAGIVGARRRDLFADGALRAGLRRPMGQAASLTMGAGIWGAAQPRVERLDIGPRAALGLPVGGTAATLAAEWRIRVAGDARPGNGLAITLAADF